MKFSLNPITAQKITNFQNTVRRLTIIFLSLFFLLVMRASIWSPYGKNLANPRGRFTLKFLLNPITKEAMTNLQNAIKRLEIIVIVFWKSFANDHQSHILEFFL